MEHDPAVAGNRAALCRQDVDAIKRTAGRIVGCREYGGRPRDIQDLDPVEDEQRDIPGRFHWQNLTTAWLCCQ
jgi:hypothetical protein